MRCCNTKTIILRDADKSKYVLAVIHLALATDDRRNCQVCALMCIGRCCVVFCYYFAVFRNTVGLLMW